MCTCKSGSMCSRKHTVMVNKVPSLVFSTKKEAIEFAKSVKESTETPKDWLFEVKCSCGTCEV